MSFSDRLWRTIDPYYLRIAAHPFNIELEEGTLSKERFDFYIRQDVSYLRVLSRVFAIISVRSITPRMASLFLTFAKDAENASRDLVDYYLVSTHNQMDAALSPACKEYTRYLYTTATSATLEEAVAAVLPCFWMYRELSKKMAEIVERNNPYFDWISLNASQNYSEMTDQLIALVNEIAADCSEKVCDLMDQACASCARFEGRFWEDAYHMRTCVAEGSKRFEDSTFMIDWKVGSIPVLESLATESLSLSVLPA